MMEIHTLLVVYTLLFSFPLLDDSTCYKTWQAAAFLEEIE